ncbi:unnamed protein product [Sphagnum troendelagicum]
MRSDEEVREVPADVEMGTITAVEGLDPRLKFAYDTWQSREAQSKKRIEDHESRERLLTNEIYQLVGFASAFQSLLLTAVAQGDSKKKIFTRLKRTLSTEVEARKTFSSRLQQLRQEGEFFDFQRTNDYIKKSNKFALRLFGFSFTAMAWVALAIGIFGVLCLVTIHRLLCHSS